MRERIRNERHKKTPMRCGEQSTGTNRDSCRLGPDLQRLCIPLSHACRHCHDTRGSDVHTAAHRKVRQRTIGKHRENQAGSYKREPTVFDQTRKKTRAGDFSLFKAFKICFESSTEKNEDLQVAGNSK